MFTQKNVEAPAYFRYELASLIQTAAEICEQLDIIDDLDDLLEQAVRLTQQSLGYDWVAVYMIDDVQQQFMAKVVSGGQLDYLTWDRAEDLPGLVLAAFQQRKVIQAGDEAGENLIQAKAGLVKSQLHIPLEHNEAKFGVFSLGSAVQCLFDEAEIVFVLRALAAQIAEAIEHIQNCDVSGLGDSNELGDTPVSVKNILAGIPLLAGKEEVFDKIVQDVVEGFGYKSALLALVDDDGRLSVQALAFTSFTHRRNWHMIEKLFGIRIIGNSVSLTSDQENMGVQTVLNNEIKVSHNLFDLFQPIIEADLSYRIQRSIDIKTYVSLPLRVGNQAIGVLIAGTQKRALAQADIDALYLFVTNAAIAVQNITLFEQLKQRLALRETELAQLQSIERTINSSLDLREVLKRILNGALDLTRAEYGQVVLAGKYASDLVSRVSFPEILDSLPEIKFGITQAIMNDKKPKLMDNTTHITDELAGIRAANNLYASMMKSLLGVPILLEDELIGVINIASQEENAFNQQSQDLLEQLAVQAAIAINNAYQFKAEQEIREQFANITQVVAMADMAGNMVHSINNKVGSIRADIMYLMRQHSQGKLTPAEITELLEDMLANAEATLAMADNIRKPFQPSPQEVIDVNKCITNVLRQRRDDLSNIIILEELAENLPPVMATRQLELVFENLLDNALSAMKDQDRGVLKFSTACSGNGRWVEITIQDSGPGLSKGLNAENIFKLGVSGRDDGLGYGLWWCDTFLKRWGGQIHFVENTRRGCKFVIKLPAMKEKNHEGHNHFYQL